MCFKVLIPIIINCMTKKILNCPICGILSINLDFIKNHFATHTCYICNNNNLDLIYFHEMEKCNHILCASCCVDLKKQFDRVPIECNKCIKDEKIEFSKKYSWVSQFSVPCIIRKKY